MAEPRTLYRVSLLIYRTVGRQLLLLLEETLDLSALLHSFPFFPSTFSLPRRSSSSPSLSPPRWMQENVTVTTRVNFFFFFSSLFIFIFVFPQDSRTCKSYEQSIRSKEGKGTRWRGDSSTSWERSSRGRITAVLSRLLPRCKEPRLCIHDAQWISTTHVITIIKSRINSAILVSLRSFFHESRATDRRGRCSFNNVSSTFLPHTL